MKYIPIWTKFYVEIGYASFLVCFYKFKVSGKAKTSDEDVFDENFGKRLAKTRAQENAFRVANALYCEIGNVLNSLVFNDFCTLTEGTEQAFLKCINHENDLICEKFHLNSWIFLESHTIFNI